MATVQTIDHQFDVMSSSLEHLRQELESLCRDLTGQKLSIYPPKPSEVQPAPLLPRISHYQNELSIALLARVKEVRRIRELVNPDIAKEDDLAQASELAIAQRFSPEGESNA